MTDTTHMAIWSHHEATRLAAAEVERAHAEAQVVFGPDERRTLGEANAETLDTGGLLDDYLRAVRRKMSAGPRRVITPGQLHNFGIGNATPRKGNN